jgi:hypothetical protein
MPVVIAEETLHAARLSPGDFKQEIAVLLFRSGPTHSQPGQSSGGIAATPFSAPAGQSGDSRALRRRRF